MSTLGPDYISGITSANVPGDVASKGYVDSTPLPSHPTLNASGNEGKILMVNGGSTTFEKCNGYQEYNAPGTYTFSIPPQASQFFIEITGAGGGGASGNLDTTSLYQYNSFQTVYTNPSSNNVYSFKLLNNLYLLAGFAGWLAASTDGTTWVLRTSGTSTSVLDLTYGNGLYLYGGVATNSVAASTDSIVWTMRTSRLVNNVQSVLFGNNLFLCCGSYGEISTSTNTIVWTLRTSGIAYASNAGIVSSLFANNKYYIIGDRLSSSTNGVVWTSVSGSPASMSNVQNRKLKYVNNTIFIAGGISSNSSFIAYSTNETVWVVRTSSIPLVLSDITYDKTFNLYSLSSSGGLALTTDLVSWVVRTNPGSTLSPILRDLSNDMVVAGFSSVHRVSSTKQNGFPGSGGGGGANSSWVIDKSSINGSQLSLVVGQGGQGGKYVDPNSWNVRTSGVSGDVTSVVYGDSTYAAGTSSGGIVFSTDSVTWTLRTSGTSSPINTLLYCNSIYLYAGGLGCLGYTTDTITWSLRTSGTTNGINCTLYENGVFMYGANSGILATSTDTVVWTIRTSLSNSESVLSLLYDGKNYLYSTGGGRVVSSTNGVIWTLRTSGTSLSINRLIYAKSAYVYCGGSGILGSSTNSTVWTLRTSGVGNSILDILFCNSKYVYTTQGGVYGLSTDLISWEVRTTSTSANKLISSYSPILVYAGNSGYISASSVTSPPSSGAGSSLSFNGKYSTYTLSVNGGNPGGNGSVGVTGGIGGVSPLESTNYYLASSGGNGGASPSGSSSVSSSVPQSSGGGGGSDNWPIGGTASIQYYGGLDTTPISTNNVYNVDGGNSKVTLGLCYASGGGGGGSVNLATLDKATYWTLRTAGGFRFINGILYSGSINGYLYCASGGFISYSTDAIVWNLRTSSTIYDLYGLSSTNNLYICSGSSSSLLVSTDTVVWTLRTVGLNSSQNLRNSTFYVNGEYWTVSGYSIINSTDTINWTIRSAPFPNPNGYVYVNGVHLASWGYGFLWASTDGAVWAIRTSGVTSSASISPLYYSNGLYLTGSAEVAVSTDTVVWSIRTVGGLSSNSNNLVKALTYAEGSYYALSTYGLSASTDAITWTIRSVNKGGSNIVYGNGVFLTSDNLFNPSRSISTSIMPDKLVGNGGNGVRGGGGGGGGANRTDYVVGEGGNGGNGFVRISWT